MLRLSHEDALKIELASGKTVEGMMYSCLTPCFPKVIFNKRKPVPW